VPAIRQKLHLSPCADFRGQLSRPCQFGRAPAFRWPQRVHRRRGPNNGPAHLVVIQPLTLARTRLTDLICLDDARKETVSGPRPCARTTEQEKERIARRPRGTSSFSSLRTFVRTIAKCRVSSIMEYLRNTGAPTRDLGNMHEYCCKASKFRPKTAERTFAY
jgi:hypothetical protein